MKPEQKIKLFLKKLIGNTSKKEEQTLLELCEVDEILKSQWENYEEIETKSKPPQFDAIFDRIEKQRKIRKMPLHFFAIAATFALLVSISIFSYLTFYNNHNINYLAHSTGKGERIEFLLNDGTKIWLNSESELKYPEKFDDERIVELTGEAYFEVAKNAQKPFIIKTGDISIKVTGTAFNVSNYLQQPNTEIVLAEGSVEILINNKEIETKLLVNERFNYEKENGKYTIEQAEIQEFSAWKNGELIFNDIDLLKLAFEMEKWYGVKFEIAQNTENHHFTFKISKESLDETIELVSFLAPLQFERHADKIVIKNK